MKARTVLGDIEQSELGVTYCHEHLILDSQVIASEFPSMHLPSADEAVAELETCSTVRTMVDAMPEGGRQIDRLVEVSRRTGINIISSTGLHTKKYYPGHPWAMTDSSDQLAVRFEADLADRCGVIKFAVGPEGLDSRTREVLEAVAMTQTRTGAPILSHCENGLLGMEQIGAMRELGIDLARVVLSHTDKVADRRYHRAMFESGANLEYDQALRHHDDPDHPTGPLLAEMVAAGYSGQLMLGTDGARRTLWKTLGGQPGLAYLGEDYQLILERHGIDQSLRYQIMVENPARWLSFLS